MFHKICFLSFNIKKSRGFWQISQIRSKIGAPCKPNSVPRP